MKYLLDTNICIYIIRNRPSSVIVKFNQQSIGEVGISSISVAELYFGVQKSRQKEQNQEALLNFLAPLVVADFNTKVAGIYGHIRAGLEVKGTPIGSLDTLIAAHAVSLGATLVTNNEREFTRVPDLILENWVT